MFYLKKKLSLFSLHACMTHTASLSPSLSVSAVNYTEEELEQMAVER